MKIIDAHIHIFSEVHGANLHGSVQGTEYGKILNNGTESPFLLPYSQKTAFTVNNLLETMEQNGIEKAVLLQNPTIGDTNEEIAQAIRAYPKLLTGVFQVDPFKEHSKDDAEQLARSGIYSSLKLEVSTDWGWAGIHSDKEFHYTIVEPFIQIARDHQLNVIIDTGDTNSAAYLPDELSSLIQKYNDVVFIVEHGGFLTPDGDRSKWEQMISLGANENVYLGICAMPTQQEDAYPPVNALQTLRILYDRFGADKLIWGTDAPVTLRNHTYRQLIDWVMVCADFLSEAEKEKIFFDNAEKVYFGNNNH